MSIEKSNSWKTSDKQQHGSLKEAQRHELMLLLYGSNESVVSTETLLDSVITHAEVVVDILKSTGRKPRARKAKVGRPKGSRTKAVPPVPIDTEAPF